MLSRRTFLSRTTGIAGAILCIPHLSLGQQPPWIRINHLGFPPKSGKFAMLRGHGEATCQIVRTDTDDVVHTAPFTDHPGDLGDWRLADLTAFHTPGRYQIAVDGNRSGAFTIDPGVYQPAIEACIGYFAIQRCGNSTTGYNAPCHLDDGIRQDNGEYRDVTGGWHDACDLRRWVAATIHGMIGLGRVIDRLGPDQIDRERVIEEMRWGNQYFLKMQEPAGYVMDWCGGDQGNAFTDNRRQTADDRIIVVDPVRTESQFHFVAAQAAMSLLTRQEDPAYARRCLDAGMRCLVWCRERRRPEKATSLAAGAIACAQMSLATADPRPGEWAVDYLGRLLALQTTHQATDDDPVTGWFRSGDDSEQPSKDIMEGNLPLIALCMMIERFGDHRQAHLWRDALRRQVDCLIELSRLSAFGTIPYGLYTRGDPGGDRRLGRYWYRWFMETRGLDWWVGINAHLASQGVGLCRAARILGDARLVQLAQRQLDWILGVNPFDAATVTGFGRNQPRLYRPGAFTPPTPHIPGGVMNGIAGTIDDQPVLGPGDWQTCEYWTPMVSYMMWLMAELQSVE